MDCSQYSVMSVGSGGWSGYITATHSLRYTHFSSLGLCLAHRQEFLGRNRAFLQNHHPHYTLQDKFQDNFSMTTVCLGFRTGVAVTNIQDDGCRDNSPCVWSACCEVLGARPSNIWRERGEDLLTRPIVYVELGLFTRMNREALVASLGTGQQRTDSLVRFVNILNSVQETCAVVIIPS